MKPFNKIMLAPKTMRTAPPLLQKKKKPLKKKKMKKKKKPRRKRMMFSKIKMVLIYFRFLAHTLRFSTPRMTWSNWSRSLPWNMDT
jgi:hypothetical protein